MTCLIKHTKLLSIGTQDKFKNLKIFMNVKKKFNVKINENVIINYNTRYIYCAALTGRKYPS